MSGTTIIDNDLLKNEIKALFNYTNRDEFNLNVVEVMLKELEDIAKGLKPCITVDEEQSEKIKEWLKKGKLNCKGYESNAITGKFKDFEINSSSSKTIISCEGCISHEDTNIYDTEETIENCTVKIWSNSDTGNVKIGWWKNEK